MHEHEPPPKQDTYTLIIQAIVAVTLTYFLWEPLYGFFRPIVRSLLAPVWQSLG